MDRHEGGRDRRVVVLNRARPQPVPPDVARLASHLAHLLDDAIEVRGTGTGVRDYSRNDFELTVFSRREDEAAARAHLEDLTSRTRTLANPFRGQVLEAGETNGLGLTSSVLTPAPRRERRSSCPIGSGPRST